MNQSERRALTVIELLVVIAIIGLLVAITIPAVQAARESARKTTCWNHLRQNGIAVQTAHDTVGHYPSGGWGFRWFGDPDRGLDREQPGGWIYNTLSYIEQQNIRRMGSGADPGAKRLELGKVVSIPLPVMHCPSRRAAALYPYLGRSQPANVDRPLQAAKCDYAGNGGDNPYVHSRGGPGSLDPQSVAAYPWPSTKETTGVFFLRSQLSASAIVDGLSHTYLIGEKNVSQRPHDPLNRDPGDDQSMYLGDDRDIRRWTAEPPRADSQAHAPTVFGSAHREGCHFVFGDGSVHLVRYSIDRDVHRYLGNRADRNPVSVDQQ